LGTARVRILIWALKSARTLDGTARSRPFIRYAGEVYQNDLAIRLKALGYQVVEEQDKRGNVIGWEIEGVSKEVRHEWLGQSPLIATGET
jgi:hypothetical protein